MNKSISTTLSCLLLFFSGWAQVEKRSCAAMEHLHQLEVTHPEVLSLRQQIEAQTQAFINKPSLKQRGVITIPVVVHVVYNLASQNISDAQIQSQINVLNADFRKMNADFANTPGVFQAAGADCELQFVLARRNPNGDSTTGITRTQTAVTSFVANDYVKQTAMGGKDPWPASDYLNIWVCKLSNGLLGYAQFPGGPVATDGVVISYRAFGTTGAVLAPFNKGRTATHEIGHWLNLFHIWGDDGGSCNGSDLVNDTPNQGGENYGCPSYPKISCNNAPSGEMFMNYMDYSDDACMSLFTAGQKARMDALFLSGGPRFSLLSSLGGVYPTPVVACGTPTVTAGSITASSAVLQWSAVPNSTSYSLQIRQAGTNTWTQYTSSLTTYSFNNLSASTTYEYQLQANCSAGTGSFTPIQTFTTAAPPLTCGTPISLSSNAISHQEANLSWQTVQDATQYSIEYRETGFNTWTSTLSGANTLLLQNLIPQTNYEFRVMATCPYGNSSPSNEAGFTTLTSPAPVCNNSFEPNETRLSATPVQKNTLYGSLIQSDADIDYYTFTTTAQQPKFKVTLSNLPADYDLKIYNSNGIQILSSQNARIQNESCIANNTAAAGTYYIRVSGYNGKYDPVNCYRLLLETGNADFKETEELSEETLDKTSIRLFPNPAQNQLTSTWYAAEPTDVFFCIYNALGQPVMRRSQTVLLGTNSLAFDISTLPNGMYLLDLQDGEEHRTEKFYIQH